MFKQAVIGILNSKSAGYDIELSQVNIVSNVTWEVYFDTSIFNDTLSATGTDTDSGTLRSIGGSGNVDANVSSPSSMVEDGFVKWWKNGVEVHSYGFMRSTSGLSENYTFTGCVRGDELLVTVEPADYIIELHGEIITSATWNALFDAEPLQITTATIDDDSSTLAATSTSVSASVARVGNVTDVSWAYWIRNGGAPEHTVGPVLAGNPISGSYTFVGCIPGDTLRIEVTEG